MDQESSLGEESSNVCFGFCLCLVLSFACAAGIFLIIVADVSR